ncbi:hypothetical protein RV11_GL000791 [Enterococcus phoeniculicola]|jgi:PTS system mannose-specific IID component|uniref:PTS system, mannose/fructose/sorbose family, IID component n=1 Tax=Enterococcus phoeniculicola ATCC BAA-412 TaxID=1158610 RepID=R3TUJ3_9ENTE|nr:PTS system mannose/fructose/sorbose family transporter subunit IID [Enterococcus phoeniculicola]EOL45274.1 hypothetical protein UC3_01164 [Enterococcus phoeniculicola ATCC BAA-412]EOT74636.1 hypothetical protein I589_02236 [Enterococcus phoeniculicola ATCC BAA-412]OJG70907.1 hypothetical protein RV11_GL000791 [Enterococcus phoeniculicola]
MSEQVSVITKKELDKAFWRTNTGSFSFGYERMQTLGMLYSLVPSLEKLYEGHELEERKNALRRHMEFFNGMTTMNGLIAGVVIAMEEKTSEEEKESVIALKTGMMGPLAGLGDSLMKFTWLPICGSIGASLALEKNILGPILMLLMFGGAQLAMRYFGVHYGYKMGISILTKTVGENSMIQRISNMANVIGCTVVGGLLVNTVKVNIGLSYAVGENKIVVQEMFDKIMPNLLPMLLTLLFIYILKKTKGKHAVALIISTLIIGVALSMLGILG